jgi:hypothetical protein
MKVLITLFIIYYFTIFSVRAQTKNWLKPNYEWLKPKLATADTIMLASYEDFSAFDNGTDAPIPVLDLVVSGHPNYKALRQHKVLTPAQRVELSRILLRPFADKQIVTMHCCDPHHVVFLIRKGSISYLKICFGCRCLSSTEDLAELYAFDNRKWMELRQLFTRLGLDYGF